MNVYEIVSPQQALEGAVQITKWGRKEATFDKFQKNILAFTESAVIAHCAMLVQPAVEEAYNTHVETLGDRDMAPMMGGNVDEWDSGLDDRLEDILEPYQSSLSQDYLATATTDSGLRTVENVDTWCQAFGKEMYKQMAHGKSPAQMMAAVGLLDEAILRQWYDYGKENGKQLQAAGAEQAVENGDEDTILELIFNSVGAEFDEDDVLDALEMAMDDDALLAGGALARLGLTAEQGDTLTMLRFGTTPAEMLARLKDRRAGTAPSREPATAQQPAGEAIPASVLMTMKDHSSAEDGKMAEALGVSRGTYANYYKGKTKFTPSNEQRNAIRDRLVLDINALTGALATLDNMPYEYVE